MELKYEDWDRVKKSVEATVKQDAITSKINKHVLAFVIKEMLRCPKTEPIKKASEKREE